MEIKTYTGSLIEHDADTVLIFQFESVTDAENSETSVALVDAVQAVDEALGGAIQDLIAQGDFKGGAGQTAVLYPRGAVKAKRVILVGAGKKADLTLEGARRAVSHGLKKARELKSVHTVAALIDGLSAAEAAFAFAEGALLAGYHYHGQKSSEFPTEYPSTFEISTSADHGEAVSQAVAQGVAFATGAITSRDLANLPPNICTPIYLASMARNMADRTGLKIEVLEREEMDALGMGAILAVAQGSDNPPRFIILEHNADRAAELETVVLVGKGVTFDTGGYSIKPGEGMIGMKADMTGAAAVIGAMQTIAMLNPDLHVVGLAPSAENMISGGAYRPQDVITASNGKTIEIISTDAEGRLLLADALVYAKRYEPSAVIDIATLTGACVVALGNQAAGLFATDDTLASVLKSAGDKTHERVWQLPLFSEYKKSIESNTADMKNSGGRMSGVASSAVFLQEFVDYEAWAHLDIAGMMADLGGDIPYFPAKGNSGFGARLLAEFVQQWAERKG